MFYSVKLGRVLYVAIHSTCIIMILFWFFSVPVSRNGIIMTDMVFDVAIVKSTVLLYVLTDMYKHVSELNRNGLEQMLNDKN